MTGRLAEIKRHMACNDDVCLPSRKDCEWLIKEVERLQPIEVMAVALVNSRLPTMDKTCLICGGYLGRLGLDPPEFGHRADCEWELLRKALA